MLRNGKTLYMIYYFHNEVISDMKLPTKYYNAITYKTIRRI